MKGIGRGEGREKRREKRDTGKRWDFRTARNRQIAVLIGDNGFCKAGVTSVRPASSPVSRIGRGELSFEGHALRFEK